jgi:transcriptional regulator NrdR family protein
VDCWPKRPAVFLFPPILIHYPLGKSLALCQHVVMVCIYCGHNTEVTNSRKKARTPLVWRRRRCETCVAQFTTHELPEYATALVVERGRVLVPFERDKLFLSVHFACSHRKDSQKVSTELTNNILGIIARKKLARDGKLTLEMLSSLTYDILKRFDRHAAATYRAYHQNTLRS